MSLPERTAVDSVLREDPAREGLYWLLDHVKLWSGYGWFARDAEALAARIGPYAIGPRHADESGEWWEVVPIDAAMFIAACPYAISSRGVFGLQRNALRMEPFGVPNYYCKKMPNSDRSEREYASGASPVARFGSCTGPVYQCPRVQSTAEYLGWSLVRSPAKTIAAHAAAGDNRTRVDLSSWRNR